MSQFKKGDKIVLSYGSFEILAPMTCCGSQGFNVRFTPSHSGSSGSIDKFMTSYILQSHVDGANNYQARCEITRGN